MPPETAVREPSVVELLRRIVGNLETIVRTELRLLKVELLDDAAAIGGASVYLVLGLGVAQLALGCLLLSLISALSTRMTPAMAALLVALGCAGVAALLLQIGRRRMAQRSRSRIQLELTQKETAPWEITANPSNS